MEMSVVSQKDIPKIARSYTAAISYQIKEKAKDLEDGEALRIECETIKKARVLSTNLRGAPCCKGLMVAQRGTSIFCWFERV